MPRDSQGQYSLPSGTLVNTGDTLQTSQHNPMAQDIANALTNSLDRGGRGGMQADLAMNQNRVTGLAPGVASTDAATVGQIGNGVPLGVPVDFWGSTAPTDFVFCFGQELSRTEFAELFAVIGTNAGAGNGTTTFNVPDYRGRVSAGRDNMGGTAASRLTSAVSGVDGATLGAVGGAQGVSLTVPQLAAHTHTGSTASAGAHTHVIVGSGVVNVNSGAMLGTVGVGAGATSSAGAHTHTMVLDNTGEGVAHNNVQPTLVCNKIMRIR